jgi:hypothetical protein
MHISSPKNQSLKAQVCSTPVSTTEDTNCAVVASSPPLSSLVMEESMYLNTEPLTPTGKLRANTNSIPDKFLCPISYLTMVDPVIAEDGFTYEREVIARWLTNHGGCSPLTREKIGSTFTADLKLKHQIQTYLGFNVLTPTSETPQEDYYDFDPDKRMNLFLNNDVYIPTKTLVEFQTCIQNKDLQKVKKLITLDPRLVFRTPHELALTVNEFIKDLRPPGRSDDEIDEEHIDSEFMEESPLPKTASTISETISAFFGGILSDATTTAPKFCYYQNGYDIACRIGSIEMVEEMYYTMQMYQPQMLTAIRLEQRNLYNNLENSSITPQCGYETISKKHIKVINRKVLNRELWRTLRSKQAVHVLVARIQQLIDFGAQVNVHGKKVGKKSNALYLCLKYQPDEIAAKILPILIEADKNILHCKCSPSEYPLYSAVKYSKVQCIKVMVEQYNLKDFAAHTNTDLYYQTAMHCAAENGDEVTLKYILSLDCQSVDCLDSRLQTPLFLAVCRNQFTNVKILVERGANLDLQNIVGNTALHVAVSHGFSPIIEYLIRNGADVNLKNRRNMKPVQMTSTTTIIELVQYLSQRQVSIAMLRVRQLQASKEQMKKKMVEMKKEQEQLKKLVQEKDIEMEKNEKRTTRTAKTIRYSFESFTREELT